MLLYEKDSHARDLLLYGLTKNLPMFEDPAHFKTKNSTIKLGGVSIKTVTRQGSFEHNIEWLSNFGLLIEENFFFDGTIKENISWRLQNYDHELASRYAKELKLYK